MNHKLIGVSNLMLVRNAATAAPKVATGGYKFDNAKYGKNIVLVEGVRTPFAQSGTDYNDLDTYELQRHALLFVFPNLDSRVDLIYFSFPYSSLLKRVPDLPVDAIDYVVCGTVIQEAKTPNVAREAIFAGGLPMNIPGSTVTQACVSANQAITSAIGYINSGTYDVVVAGGVETASDVPIRHSRKMRKLLLELNRARTTQQRLKLLTKLRPDYFAPEVRFYFTFEKLIFAN